MKLMNFELSEPSFSVELLGLNFLWDLHNAGKFLGINVEASDNTAVMRWTVSGHPAAKYSGCNLVFTGLKLIIVSPRDEELPYSEDLCVSGMSKVIPELAEKPQYRRKREWSPSDPFHLFFEFQSRRSIEIDAETVELIGVARSS